MIPLSTTIEGIGPHERTTIDWSALRSPIAVTAPYGTGKTMLLDSIPGALGFDFPWYAGSVYDVLTQGGNGVARITMTFEHGGIRYMADHHIKNTGKTKSHKVLLTEADTGKTIAGPKVSDFCAKIQSTIGDKDTFLSTVYMSQNRTRDLCGQPGEKDLVARRREVFNELSGAGELDKTEERYGKVERKKTATVEELEAQLAGEPDFAAVILQEVSSREYAEDIESQKQPTLRMAERDLEAARTKLRDAEGGDDVLRAQINEHERCQATVAQAETRAGTVKSELESLTLRASGLEQAVGKRERLEYLQRRREDLQAQQRDFDEWQRWDWRRQEIGKDIEAAERAVHTLEAFPGVDEETKALAAKVDDLVAEYIVADEQNRKALKDNNEIESAMRSLGVRLAIAEDNLKRVRILLQTNPETLFGDECKTCPQIKTWADLPNEEERIVGEKAAIEQKIALLPKIRELKDLSDLISQGSQARAAAKSVKDAAESEAQLARNRLELAERQGELAGHEATRPRQVADPHVELLKTQTEIDDVAGAPEQVKACEQAAHDAAAKQIALDKADASLAEAKRLEELARPAAELARSALDNREAQRAAIRADVQVLETRVKELRAEVEELTKQIARHETRIEELERRQAEQAEKRERVKTIRDDLADIKLLRMCFGPRGVRQILIDNAAPELEDIADDLFERATGGKMRLRIATQRANVDGSIAEDFQILVRDDRGERDALRYSGGQLQLIQILFRIAVALWVGRIRGHKADCLFLDEAFDRLGADGTEDLLRVLEYLGDQIGLIVVVTHDPLIADRMASQIVMRKRFGGVEVEVIGSECQPDPEAAAGAQWVARGLMRDGMSRAEAEKLGRKTFNTTPGGVEVETIGGAN